MASPGAPKWLKKSNQRCFILSDPFYIQTIFSIYGDIVLIDIMNHRFSI